MSVNVKKGQVTADIALALAERRHKDDFVVSECKSGATWFNSNMRRMDLVAVKKSWARPLITAYEIKVVRGDFLADDKWPEYMQYCDCFYFACPKGIITKEDLEAIQIKGIGLVYVSENGWPRTIKKALNRQVAYNADFLMYLLMNRVDRDRFPFHSTKADYFQTWLRTKKFNHSLGYQVRSALVDRVLELEREIQRVVRKEEDREELSTELMKSILKEYNIRDVLSFRRLMEDVEKIKKIYGIASLNSFMNMLSRLHDDLEYVLKG